MIRQGLSCTDPGSVLRIRFSEDALRSGLMVFGLKLDKGARADARKTLVNALGFVSAFCTGLLARGEFVNRALKYLV